MGEGLKRVAKQCGGLTATSGGESVHYDADGKSITEYLISRGWRELPYTAGRWRNPMRHSEILKTHEAYAEAKRCENPRGMNVA